MQKEIYRHVKRGTCYHILGYAKHSSSLRDNEIVGLTIQADKAENVFVIHDSVDANNHMTGTIQISTSYYIPDSLIVYQCLHDNKIWIRPEKEFFDGRFELVKSPS